MRAVHERGRLVQELVRPCDHASASRGVESSGFRLVLVASDDVGAVQRIVEAAPAGVRGIQGVAGVVDRDDELRAGDQGYLVIDVLGLDPEVLAGREQVADGFQEPAVLGRVDGLRRTLRMPCVDPGLELGPPIEQRPVLRPEVPDDVRERAPERFGRNAGPGGNLVVDQVMQAPGDFETADSHSLAHRFLSCIVDPLDPLPRRGTG